MKLIKLIIALVTLGAVTSGSAGLPIFNVTPVTPPPTFIVAGTQATASYQISLNTHKLTAANALMPQYTSPANVISQYKLAATDCSLGLFFLDFGSSCLLRINIDATHLVAGQTIVGGPVICSDPSAPHFCAQSTVPFNIPIVSSGDGRLATLTVTPASITLSNSLPVTITVTNMSSSTINNILATPDADLASKIQSINYTGCTSVAAAASCTITVTANTNSGSGKLIIQGANSQSVTRVVSLVAPLIVVGNAINLDVVSSTPIVLLSPDRTTWSRGTLPSNLLQLTTLAAVATHDNQSLIIGNTLLGGPVILSSQDNVTWQQVSLPLAITELEPVLTSVAYGQNQWIVGGYTGNEAESQAFIIYSANGINWNLATLPQEAQTLNSNINQISCAASQCLAVSGEPRFFVNSNGIIPSPYKKPLGSDVVNLLFTSQDGGKTWQNQPLPTSLIADFSFTGVAVGNGVWIVSGDNNLASPDTITGQILTSTDAGQTWQNEQGAFSGLSAIHFQNNLWLALPYFSGISSTPQLFISSNNAQSWTTINFPVSFTQIGVPLAFNASTTPWVFAGASLSETNSLTLNPIVLATSDKGATWSQLTLPTLPPGAYSLLKGIN